MKKVLLFLWLIGSGICLQAQTNLSGEAYISILTSSPSDDEVFTVYGHTAMRVKDDANKIDYIFNYGIFDFSKPNFIYRFAKGETDYKLEIFDYRSYLAEYQMRGSSVVEQVLNLTHQEKENIFEALMINYRPENKVYRYNFFFDNCSTRPAVLIENNVEGTILYPPNGMQVTFRDMINYCTRNHPWQTFGCDLALGSPTDRVISREEQMFLPEFLMAALADAVIIDAYGHARNLVSKTNRLAEEIIDEDAGYNSILTPLFCGWLLFIIVSGLSVWEWKRKSWFRWLDFLLFLIAGAAGVVLAFLMFVSEHPCTYPNWLILWLHPLQLAGAILFALKKAVKAAYYYHFINFAALSLLLAGWYFIPQHFNAAFIPLAGSMWLRSALGVYRFKSV